MGESATNQTLLFSILRFLTVVSTCSKVVDEACCPVFRHRCCRGGFSAPPVAVRVKVAWVTHPHQQLCHKIWPKKTPQTLPQATASPFFFIGQQVAVRETQRNSVQLRHNVTESVATKLNSRKQLIGMVINPSVRTGCWIMTRALAFRLSLRIIRIIWKLHAVN